MVQLIKHRCPTCTTFEIFDKPVHTVSFREGLVEEDHEGKRRLSSLIDCATEICLRLPRSFKYDATH